MLFRDVIHNRVTENVSLESPSLDSMFVELVRTPMDVINIFNDERGPLAPLQDRDR